MRFLLFFLFACTAPLGAQTLSGISSRWNDSFAAWEIFALPDSTAGEDEDGPREFSYGELKLRWLDVRNDWSEWDYRLGEEEQGTIKMKWKDDPSQWELRSYSGDIITMRTAWAGDFNEWRITDNSTTISLKTRWTNQADEWLVKDPSRGNFYLYTLRENDPRDWAIEDDLDPSVSRAMKLAFIFIALFHGSPRM